MIYRIPTNLQEIHRIMDDRYVGTYVKFPFTQTSVVQVVIKHFTL